MMPEWGVKIQEMLSSIQEYWDDEEDRIDSVYLLEDIQRDLNSLREILKGEVND